MDRNLAFLHSSINCSCGDREGSGLGTSALAGFVTSDDVTVALAKDCVFAICQIKITESAAIKTFQVFATLTVAIC
jgi:hypothetical protein